MRKTFQTVLKEFFCPRLCNDRLALGLTQEQMARKLSMSVRTYSDLERGNACCSAVSLLLYLFDICQDPGEFLQELREEFNAVRAQKTGKK